MSKRKNNLEVNSFFYLEFKPSGKKGESKNKPEDLITREELVGKLTLGCTDRSQKGIPVKVCFGSSSFGDIYGSFDFIPEFVEQESSTGNLAIDGRIEGGSEFKQSCTIYFYKESVAPKLVISTDIFKIVPNGDGEKA